MGSARLAVNNIMSRNIATCNPSLQSELTIGGSDSSGFGTFPNLELFESWELGHLSFFGPVAGDGMHTYFIPLYS